MAAIVEVWTAPFVATTGEVIASSDANAGYRGNLLWIRQFLSANPGSANLVVASTGVNGGGWATVASLIAANDITEAMLNVSNAPSDSQVMTYESSVGGFTWSFILAKHITDGVLTSAKYAAESITEPKLDSSNGPTTNQVLSVDTGSGRMFWTFVTASQLNANAVEEAKLDVVNSPTDAQVLTYNTATGRLQWTFVTTAQMNSGSVATGSIINEAVTEPKLDVDNSGSDTYLLSYVGSSGRMRWVSPPSGTAGIPSGLVGMFQSAAALAAATGWSAYSGLAGRIMVGVGTVDGQTFAAATDYGTDWDHGHTTSASGSGSGSGTGATATGTTGTGTTGTGTTGDASGSTITDNLKTVTPEEADASAKSHAHSVPGLSVPGLSIPSLGVTVGSVTVSSVTTTGTAASTTYLPPMHALVPGIKT